MSSFIFIFNLFCFLEKFVVFLITYNQKDTGSNSACAINDLRETSVLGVQVSKVWLVNKKGLKKFVLLKSSNDVFNKEMYTALKKYSGMRIEREINSPVAVYRTGTLTIEHLFFTTYHIPQRTSIILSRSLRFVYIHLKDVKWWSSSLFISLMIEILIVR